MMKVSQSLWYNNVRTMNTDEKILKTLEDLKDGQKALQTEVQKQGKQIESLQADVTAMKGEVEKIPTIEKQLTQQGKLLNEIASNMGTVLTEQQAQRIDIRSLHTEVHASIEELRAEIREARDEAKRDNIDLKATVVKQLKTHEKRIDGLEDDAGIPHPDKN